MIKCYDWEQEWFIFKTYMDMDKSSLDLEYIQTAYSFIPGNNPLLYTCEPKMKQAIRRYVISNGQIFNDYEVDYQYGIPFTQYQEGDETNTLFFYDITPEIQFYMDMGNTYQEAVKLNQEAQELKNSGKAFSETIPITNDDQKAMEDWNRMMEKQYPTKTRKTSSKKTRKTKNNLIKNKKK